MPYVLLLSCQAWPGAVNEHGLGMQLDLGSCSCMCGVQTHLHDLPALPQDAAEYLEHGGQSGQAVAAAVILYSAPLLGPASQLGELTLAHQPHKETRDHQLSASPDADCIRAAVGPRPPSLTARPRVGVRKVVEVGAPCSCQLCLCTVA